MELDESSRVFESLKQNPKNCKCFDCGSSESNWCSVSHGIFICLLCAGIHRSLGVHISFVKSITIDTWSPKQLQLVSVGGNEKLQSVFEEYKISEMDIQNKYRTKAAYYYRNLIKSIAENKENSKEKPTLEEGAEIIKEERRVIEKKPEEEKLPEKNGIRNLIEDSISITKELGKNIKGKIKGIKIKDIKSKAKETINTIENKVEGWKVKEKLKNVKDTTESYYKSLGQSAKLTLDNITLIKMLVNDKLTEGEDELLLDPQGKSKKTNNKK